MLVTGVAKSSVIDPSLPGAGKVLKSAPVNNRKSPSAKLVGIPPEESPLRDKRGTNCGVFIERNRKI